MRSYGEAIDVRTVPAVAVPALPEHDGEPGHPRSAVPSQFLWRGRVYVVREVLAHWIELGTWWTTRALQPTPARPRRVLGHPVEGAGTPAPSSSPAAPPSHAAPRSVAADVGAVEREVWRVEASAGRSSAPGVYDLVRDIPAHDPVAGPRPLDAAPARWRLARTLD